MNLRNSIIGLGLCALLAACGDSPETADAPPAAANEVPASATASTRAYATFAGSLAPSDTHEPLDVNKVVPPTSETEEPQAI
jgi:hypothetical protein